MKNIQLYVTSLIMLFLCSSLSQAQEDGKVSSMNKFNRMLKPKAAFNLSPEKDGLHDVENPGVKLLQSPKAAFETLDKSKHGNHVDWVSSLNGKKIEPRWDRLDGTQEPMIFDLNIVREVKGSTPNVVYPHKQHTQWLDCSNCHPDIFIPQKGANQISMASILLGEKCGVCHGKVAFPVTISTCTKCHSQPKDAKAVLKRSKASLKK